MIKINLLRISLLINIIVGILMIGIDLDHSSFKGVLAIVLIFAILFNINHKALTKMSNEEVKKLLFC